MIPSGVRIFVCTAPVDLRHGFDRLAQTARERVGTDPMSGGALFVFANKRATRIKVLWFDGQGLCLFAKRLEKGRFVWPPIVDGALTLTPAQLALLIEAMDWRRTVAPPPTPQPMLI